MLNFLCLKHMLLHLTLVRPQRTLQNADFRKSVAQRYVRSTQRCPASKILRIHSARCGMLAGHSQTKNTEDGNGEQWTMDHGPYFNANKRSPPTRSHSMGLPGSNGSASSSSLPLARPARISGKHFFTACAPSSLNRELPSKAIRPHAARSAMA